MLETYEGLISERMVSEPSSVPLPENGVARDLEGWILHRHNWQDRAEFYIRYTR